MTATISHTRLRVLFAFFTVASLLLSARLAYWQTVARGDLLSRATDQVHSDLAVAAQRGIIRDRTGAILATTVELRSLYAIPAQMKDSEGHDTRSAGSRSASGPRGRRRTATISGSPWTLRSRTRPNGSSRRSSSARGPRAARSSFSIRKTVQCSRWPRHPHTTRPAWGARIPKPS